jgi:hypothetical protein
MARIYTTNENYFNSIDSERKAYFLGFIMADGSIRLPQGNRQGVLTFGIHHEDSYILEELMRDVVPDGKVHHVHSPSIQANGHSAQARVNIISTQIVNDLGRLGVYHRKTYVGMTFPDLPQNLIRHFIRGYFDGNGGITVNEVRNRYVRTTSYEISNPFKRKLRKRSYFCGPDLEFLRELWKYLPEGIGEPYHRFKRSCHVLTAERLGEADILAQYLYEGATIFMHRKRSKFNMTISSQASDTSEEGSETTGGVQTP